MKNIISLVITLFLVFALYGCTPHHSRGAAAGAAAGGFAGTLLDRHNPWRGGVIGAAIGAVIGATLADISMRASQEAAAEGRPVRYRTEDGRAVYRADPVDYNARTDCHKVRERVWEDGQLVKDEVREVCESRKREPGY